MKPNTIQSYLKDRLTLSGYYQLTDQDKFNIEKEGLSQYIFKKLTSKKYRKLRMSTVSVEHTIKAIDISIKHNRPINFVFPQGGYKLWRLPSSPEIDWAEFFNLSYLISYLGPIAATYEPGVILTYYHFDRLMELHDNLTAEEISAYKLSFTRLMDEFSQHLPRNLKLSIISENDLYPGELYNLAIESDFKRAEKEFDSFPQDRKDRWEKSAILNIKPNGQKNWTKLSKAKMQEKIRLACIYENAAAYCLTKVWSDVITDQTILIFVKPIAFGIAIGSTKTSTAKHWAGYGIIENMGDKYYERILTPLQYERVKNHPHSLRPISISNLKNLQTIEVYPQRFDFSRK